GHQVAIKVPASHSCTKQQVQAFLQEIKIWYPLRHPNILQLYGACNSSNHDYPLIVMEAMECNLSQVSTFQRLRSGPPLNLMDVLTYCYEIATGISFLHTRAKPVLHGDIKSSNVLLDRMGQVKIADFGFSRVISDANGGSVNASVAGIGGGTYYFMAPERLSGGALTAQVDVYAFGMTCFEIINKGRAPFPSDIQQVTQLFGHVVIEKRRPILPR
ncbi:kinase-like domain-containing protein, partial [Cladochytrium replicatum]